MRCVDARSLVRIGILEDWFYSKGLFLLEAFKFGHKNNLAHNKKKCYNLLVCEKGSDL